MINFQESKICLSSGATIEYSKVGSSGEIHNTKIQFREIQFWSGQIKKNPKIMRRLCWLVKNVFRWGCTGEFGLLTSVLLKSWQQSRLDMILNTTKNIKTSFTAGIAVVNELINCSKTNVTALLAVKNALLFKKSNQSFPAVNSKRSNENWR